MINITNVTKKYGSLTAVDNISLEIKDNEIFGFLVQMVLESQPR